MRKCPLLILLPALFALLYSSANGQDAPLRTVIASGGVNASGPAIRIAGTLGQPVIGPILTLHRTAWQGFWYAQPTATAAVAGPGRTATTLLQCTPNPVVRSATVRLHAPAAGEVRVTLHDLLGRSVAQLAREQRGAGDFSVELDAADLPQGQYTIRFAHALGETTLPVLVVK